MGLQNALWFGGSVLGLGIVIVNCCPAPHSLPTVVLLVHTQSLQLSRNYDIYNQLNVNHAI